MCNVIIEKDATCNLKEFLIENYKNKNVAFVTTKSNIKNYKEYLQCLKNLPLNLEVYFIEENAKCNKYNVLFLENMVKDSEFIVCFGVLNIIDITKFVAQKLNINYAIIPTMLCESNYVLNYVNFINEDDLVEKVDCIKPNCVYIDSNLIAKTSKRNVASAFAYILSLNLILCKLLYEDENSSGRIKELSYILKGINIFTSENICLDAGKIKLFKLMLEIQLKLNELNINNTLEEQVAIYYKFYSKNNNLLYGEISFIFAFLILSIEENVLNNKICLPPININKRIERLKTLFNKDKYIDISINNMLTKDTENLLKEINNERKEYIKIVTLALNRINNNMAMLKRIYIDKGTMYHKINTYNFYNALSLSADLTNEKYLLVLRDLGVFDNL